MAIDDTEKLHEFQIIWLSSQVHALFRRQHFALKEVDFDSYHQLYEFKFWQRRSCVLERR